MGEEEKIMERIPVTFDRDAFEQAVEAGLPETEEVDTEFIFCEEGIPRAAITFSVRLPDGTSARATVVVPRMWMVKAATQITDKYGRFR